MTLNIFFDRGNRNVKDLSKKILNRLQNGDIIMLHDTLPRQTQAAEYWQRELERLFAVLQSDFNVVPLETLLGRPIMNTYCAEKKSVLSLKHGKYIQKKPDPGVTEEYQGLYPQANRLSE